MKKSTPTKQNKTKETEYEDYDIQQNNEYDIDEVVSDMYDVIKFNSRNNDFNFD